MRGFFVGLSSSTRWVHSTISMLLHCPLTKEWISATSWENFLGTPRIEPRAAGCEATDERFFLNIAATKGLYFWRWKYNRHTIKYNLPQIRKILPQFTWFGLKFDHYREILKRRMAKDFVVRGIKPGTLSSTFLIQCKVAPQACVLQASSQRPGKVALW